MEGLADSSSMYAKGLAVDIDAGISEVTVAKI